jgi:hypothetical protein
MVSNMVLLGQGFPVPANGPPDWVVGIVSGLLLFVAWIALFLVPVLIWRGRVRRRGYPGLRAYLRELPQTKEQKLDAVELTLKGIVICILGVLFPPVVLIGLFPLYYGARKVASVSLGIAGGGKEERWQ